MSSILKIAHRGASGYEPENSRAAFQKAIELGADMIELDVYACKSGELVLMHDSTVDRTTDGSGFIADFSLAELKTFKLSNGESILTLEEALELIDRRIKVNIEVKTDVPVQKVASLIQKYVKEKGWTYDQFLVSSFNHWDLKKIAELDSSIIIGALLGHLSLHLAQEVEDLSPYSIHPHLGWVSRELIDDAHRRGMKVFIWTANEKREIEQMIELGADGIFSNFPDRI